MIIVQISTLITRIFATVIRRRVSTEKERIKWSKQIALVRTIIIFLLNLRVWFSFDSSFLGYQFYSQLNTNVRYGLRFGIDGISLYFVLLTRFIMPICVLSNWNNINYQMSAYMICLLLLEVLLIAVFTIVDILFFYVFFERVLIPLFIIVGVWGGSDNRIRAAFLLFLYTLFGSLFMLLSILTLYYYTGTTDLEVLKFNEIRPNTQKILWLGFFISLAIKTPIWPFHLWLFRAHAERPIAGSIRLASLILKLSIYGYIRILIPILPERCSFYSPLVYTLGLISIVYASLSTIIQTDFKALVAYSSVAHMGVTILGLFSNSIHGIEGSIILGIAHGFVSPALFILVGRVLYDRYHTRYIQYYKGLTTNMPIFAVFFFLFTIANTGIPLSLNWIGEIMSLVGRFNENMILISLRRQGIVFSARYSIFLFNRMRFGRSSIYLLTYGDLTRREFMLMLPLLIRTYGLGIFPNVILNDIHIGVSSLIYN